MATATLVELVNWSGKKGWNRNINKVVPDFNGDLGNKASERPLEPVIDTIPATPVNTKRLKGKRSGLYPIHEAAIDGHDVKLIVLLQRGAQINVRKGDSKRRKKTRGLVPLHGAASAGNMAAMKVLLHSRCDVNVKSENGWSALHFAARGGHTAAAELLLKHGAHINSKTSSGDTVLHVAASRFTTDLSTLQVILHHEADLDMTNHENLKAIDVATEVAKEAIREEVERRRRLGYKEDVDVKHL